MNILCPVCKKILYPQEKSCRCENGHCFDYAKEGYLNLNLHNSQNTGDNAAMMRARREFLDKGYYSFLREEINRQLKEEESLIDLACGEGYYTSSFPCRDKVGIDLSKSGLKYASRNDKTTLYLLNSIFRNPLPDACADVVVTIFAPIAEKEIYRLLKENGRFILVRPDRDHLYELKQAIYDNPYQNDAETIVLEGFHLEKEIPLSQKTIIKKEDILNLFMMTPYCNTTSPKDKEKLDRLEELAIRFSFLIDIYRKDG